VHVVEETGLITKHDVTVLFLLGAIPTILWKFPESLLRQKLVLLRRNTILQCAKDAVIMSTHTHTKLDTQYVLGSSMATEDHFNNAFTTTKVAKLCLYMKWKGCQQTGLRLT